MEVSVLGPVEVALNGARVDLGTPKQRALVAALALARGRAVSVDALVDLLWGDKPPPGVTATLQSYVSQLRRVLEPGRERRAPATLLVTVAPGYALNAPDDAVDAGRLEQAVTRWDPVLRPLGDWGPPRVEAAVLDEASAALAAAVAAWRGTPYAELGDAPHAAAERTRLEELRLVALEDLALAGLALGRHATVAVELEALTAVHPLRERLWALRAVALLRSGRQAEALETLGRLRELLAEELGIDLSPELRDLHTAVLRQDPRLEWTPPRQPALAGAAAPPRAPTASQPPAAPDQQAVPAGPAWPMVGRDAQLAALLDALAGAEAGTPSYAVLTGEAGIGKSRLASELMVAARERGAHVVAGRCSQDDGAPPLWPWRAVLDGLGMSLEVDGDGSGGGRFRTWERIVDAVRAAAQARPLVVVLDDLHWADTSTLRVLRLLVETVEEGRLLVLGTWRPQALAAGDGGGALADVAESLGRAHAVRLDLGGLTEDAVAAVLSAVTGREPTAEQARELRARTDGNPFFLVEYARLAGERTDLDRLLREEEPPAGVSDVLRRRLARLSDEAVGVLRVAAAIGREFDLATLAAGTGMEDDDLLDVLEQAQAAGLLRELDVEVYLFSHALVRDTLGVSTTATRRARIHARLAGVLEGVPGRETEVALHWRAAGPSYARRAWRAARTAAGVARSWHAYDEAAELLHSALDSLAADQEGTLQDRYDLLMELIDAYRWAAQLPPLVACVEQAIEVGKRLRDPEAVGRAAIATSVGVLWRSAPPGEVNEVVTSALRGTLERLPEGDSPLRCRTMLALANELEPASSPQERRALVEEALAMAARIGDPALRLDACQLAYVALWTPGTAEERLGWITEAIELARETGDERAQLVSSVLRAALFGELGRPHEMRAAAAVARASAERLRIAFGEMVLDGLEAPWLALAGRFDEAEEMLEHLRRLDRRLAHDTAEETALATLLTIRLWQDRAEEAVPVLLAFDDTSHPFSASVAVFLWRAGRHQEARDYYERHGAPLDHDEEISLLAWSHAAELALYLGDSALGSGAYERLSPLAGHCTCAGSGLAMGPVDAYLAFAAAAAGEPEVAARHAARTLELVEEWEIPRFGRWFTGVREAHAF